MKIPKHDLETYEAYLLEQVESRKALGGYSTDARTMEMLCRIALALIQAQKK